MPNASAKPNLPNGVTKTRLCVDHRPDGDFAGTAYNPFLPEDVSFGQIKGVLLTLERFFDDIDHPQPYYKGRTFSPEKVRLPAQRARLQVGENREQADCRGQMASFDVEVHSRRNATWQGRISWLEGGRTAEFRSVLEMLLLMDLAFASDRSPKESKSKK